MALEIGDVIQDKYKIVCEIGQGGMGAVFEGQNLAIARRVAIKVLHSGVASQAGVVERFEREAQAAGRIGNDHILEVLDMGTLADGDRFMVMEFLEGETLQDRIQKRGRMSPAEAANLSKQLLTGLLAAHSAGIIHRDLKPENVFILREKAGRSDFVKIIDFGISKFTQLSGDMKMTATGAVMGTPYYMSPEQAKGTTAADARSDLYAVGVILYKAITGQVPFDGQTFNELLFKIVLSPLPNAREFVPDLDPAFESIICKAMARDAADRFQTAEEFIKALTAWEASGAGVSLAPASTAEARTRGAMDATAMGPDPRGGGVLPAHTPAGTMIEPHVAPLAAGPGNGQAPPIGTSAEAWSNTELGIPKKSSGALIAAVAIGGLLLLGGAAFAAYTAFGEAPAPAAASDGASEDTTEKPVAAQKGGDEPEVTPVEATAATAVAPTAANGGSPEQAEVKPQVAKEPGARKPATIKAGTPSPARPRAPRRRKPARRSPTTKKPSGNPDFGY